MMHYRYAVTAMFARGRCYSVVGASGWSRSCAGPRWMWGSGVGAREWWRSCVGGSA